MPIQAISGAQNSGSDRRASRCALWNYRNSRGLTLLAFRLFNWVAYSTRTHLQIFELHVWLLTCSSLHRCVQQGGDAAVKVYMYLFLFGWDIPKLCNHRWSGRRGIQTNTSIHKKNRLSFFFFLVHCIVQYTEAPKLFLCLVILMISIFLLRHHCAMCICKNGYMYFKFL